jgi:addiction module HigA family antidote
MLDQIDAVTKLEDLRVPPGNRHPTHRPPTHPGEMLLKEFLEPLGVSQVEAAKRMNITFQRLNAIVRGRRGVSVGTALWFEALTHWEAEIWLTLQAKWDLWHTLTVCGHRPKVRALPKRVTPWMAP